MWDNTQKKATQHQNGLEKIIYNDLGLPRTSRERNFLFLRSSAAASRRDADDDDFVFLVFLLIATFIQAATCCCAHLQSLAETIKFQVIHIRVHSNVMSSLVRAWKFLYYFVIQWCACFIFLFWWDRSNIMSHMML